MGKKAGKDVTVPLVDLSYREIQTQLKALGLPAKGSADMLRERLAEARGQAGTSGTANGSAAEEEVPKTPAAPATSRKTRTKKGEEDTLTRETYVVTTKMRPGSPDQRSGRADALLSASKAAFPEAQVSVEPVAKGHETPLDKARRLARKSASEVQKSAAALQKQIRGRQLTWLWPTLAALLLTVLLVSQWKHSGYWQKQMSVQVESLQQGLDSLYQSSQHQAARVGENVRYGYGYAQDGLSAGTARLSKQTLALWESSSTYAADAYGRALQHLPSTKKLRALLPTTACSARLNATRLDPIFPGGATWEGVHFSLQEAWAGLKDDPLKGTGILLAGGDRGVLRTAAAAIQSAVPPDCKHCYLHIKGEDWSKGGPDAAGELQAKLVAHLEACPYAIIHIEAVNAVHSDTLPVLLAALSEQGSMIWDGKQVPAHKAIYIGSTHVPRELLEQTNESDFAAAVKKDLVFQLEMSADPTQLIVPQAFRRRWEVVAPIRKSTSNPL